MNNDYKLLIIKEGLSLLLEKEKKFLKEIDKAIVMYRKKYPSEEMKKNILGLIPKEFQDKTVDELLKIHKKQDEKVNTIIQISGEL